MDKIGQPRALWIRLDGIKLYCIDCNILLICWIEGDNKSFDPLHSFAAGVLLVLELLQT